MKSCVNARKSTFFRDNPYFYIKSEREEAKEEGKEEAKEEALKNVIEICYDLSATIPDTISKIVAKFHMTQEEAEKKVNQYWKGF